MKTAKDIAQAMASMADEVARHLLPQGKRIGNEWCVGSLGGEPGNSLRVHLSGSKAGIWADFSSGDRGGDLLDLWREVHRVSMRDAMADAARYANVDLSSTVRPSSARAYSVPKPPRESVPAQGKALAYLCGERRISEAVVASYRVACDETAIVFPFFDDTGDMVFWKRLGLARPEGRKQIQSAKDARPILFGWQGVPEGSRFVVITEGEVDCLSVATAGLPALSVPHGAGNGNKNAWIEHDYDRLARFDEIYVCFDQDEPGQKAAQDVIQRIGRHRCRLVSLPEKDANEVLQKLGPVVLRTAIERADPIGPKELRQIADYIDDARARMFPGDDGDGSLGTPWDKANEKLRFRPGEVIVLAGYNGSGKSQMAGHLTIQMLLQGQKACLASMEFVPGAVLARLVPQITGLRKPAEAYFNVAVEWLRDRLWSYSVSGSANLANMRESFEYAYRRFGCKWFVIDNLAKCGVSEDDYNGQKAVVDMLTDFARDFQVTVLLVHHTRKGQTENIAPGKMDIKGTGAITDMVDTVMTVWRNKPKEEAIQAGIEPAKRSDMEGDDAPDALLAVVKQRHGDWEGKISLWFDQGSYQFLAGPQAKPFRYVGYMSQENMQ